MAYLANIFKKELIKETSKPNKRAASIVPITKPGTKYAAKYKRPTFITNENRPNVIRVMGNVSITNIGFTNIFSTPITMATIKAV